MENEQTEETISEEQSLTEEKPEPIVEPIKKTYNMTPKRAEALAKAREKKKAILNAGKKAIVQDEVVPTPEPESKPEEAIVRKTVTRVSKQKAESPLMMEEPMVEERVPVKQEDRLTEKEIREYLHYKRAEEDEYKRILMIKKQVEKENKYKKGYASVFGN